MAILDQRSTTFRRHLRCVVLVVLTAFSSAAAGSIGLDGVGVAESATESAMWVPIPGHVLPNLGHASAVAKPHRGDEALVLTIVLRRDDVSGFESWFKNVSDPTSAEYRQFIAPHLLAQRFGPSQDTYDALIRHLEQYGFAVIQTSNSRQTLTVSGSRNAALQALSVHLDDYRSDGRWYFATTGEPMLPPELAVHVEAIIGLTDRPQPQPVTVDQALNLCGAVTVVFGVIPITALAAYFVGLICAAGQIASNPASPSDYCGFLPPVLAAICSGIAIGVDPPFGNPFAGGASGAGPHNPPPAGGGAGGLGTGTEAALALSTGDVLASGAGQTIAIASFSAFDPADVADWLAVMGVDPARMNQLTRVPVNGGTTSNVNETEVLLDIAAIWSIAPDANIRVYEAPFAGPGSSFQALFSAMIDDGVDIISNSFAYCENNTSAADVQSIDAILQTAAATGISVFSASGDRGSTCLNGSPNTAHVPSGSPNLTAVGGSRLSFGPGFTYGSESWWNGSNDVPPTGQGGFGLSAFFNRPAYQDGLHSSPQRSLPDVVVNADPAIGYILCQANDGGCPTGKLYGGTSVAAPVWAGFAALLNEASGMNLGLLNPLIYAHAGSEAFHDAASMGTDFAHVGLGSPNLDVLFRQLAGIPEGQPDPARSEVNYAGSVLGPLPGTVPGFAVQGIPADGVSAAVVVVTLRDGDGHTVSGRDVALAADSGAVQIEPATTLTTDSNGQAAFLLRNLIAEVVTLTATDVAAATALADQPIIPFAVPPAASAGIVAFPTTVNANGVASTPLTVTLQDALGRPAPAKEVRLMQGAGHSVITAPVPPLTDANGEIAFTATNVVNETVTYTATVVSDIELPVPGNVAVTFQNGAGGCGSEPAPTGVNGWTVEPFATGFAAAPLFFGNVNFGTCSGADLPTFLGERALLPNFRTGDLFEFARAIGGSPLTPIANLGPTLTVDAVGKDGRLYARRVSTGGSPFTGVILELDPLTGAVLRTVASGLTCPHSLVVDPLSGDLFFDGLCFGAGTDDPLVHRVRDPAGPAPQVETYATLPRTPNGRMSFAPDGTLYVVTGYLDAQPAVVRVSGTDQPMPPTVEPLPGVHSFFWVNVVESGAGGAASKLAVLQSNGLNLLDLTVSPPVGTVIAEGIGSGVIGPDGCLYATLQHTVYRLLDPTGGCGFLPGGVNPTLRLDLDPGSPAPLQGSRQQLVATLSQLEPLADVPVAFRISGANEQLRLVNTDVDGRAVLDYQGVFSGTDQINATALRPGDFDDVASNRVQIDWPSGPHTSFISLNESALSGAPGVPVSVSATLVDVSVVPSSAVVGASITFTLDGADCNAVTDGLGQAICEMTPAAPGNFVLSADFVGNAGLTAARDVAGFDVFIPLVQDGDGIFKDGFEDP